MERKSLVPTFTELLNAPASLQREAGAGEREEEVGWVVRAAAEQSGSVHKTFHLGNESAFEAMRVNAFIMFVNVYRQF